VGHFRHDSSAPFDYVDTGREVPDALARWDDITFVGSAIVSTLSIMMAIAVVARAWSRPSRVPDVSTQRQHPDASLSVVRY